MIICKTSTNSCTVLYYTILLLVFLVILLLQMLPIFITTILYLAIMCLFDCLIGIFIVYSGWWSSLQIQMLDYALPPIGITPPLGYKPISHGLQIVTLNLIPLRTILL